MKVKYIGADIGIDGLFDGHVYEVLRIDHLTGYLAVVDESGEDYLYSPTNPKPIASPNHPGGKFLIVEDDAQNSLHKAIYG